MAISAGTIQNIAEKEATSINRTFADDVARKLRAKAKYRERRWEFEAAHALEDMAEVFETEGWKL